MLHISTLDPRSIMDARSYIAYAWAQLPMLQRVLLEEYDSRMRGGPTPFLDRDPMMNKLVDAIERHFSPVAISAA